MDLTCNQSSCSSLSVEGERSFIKCGKTNLISVVSKLENLLTKVIFQFSLSSSPLSPFYSFMYHSFVSLGNLIYYIFLWGIISLSLFSCYHFVTGVTECEHHQPWPCSIWSPGTRGLYHHTSAPFVTQSHIVLGAGLETSHGAH